MISDKHTRLFLTGLVLVFSLAGVAFGVYLVFVMGSLYAKALALAFLVLTLISALFNVMAARYFYQSQGYSPPATTPLGRTPRVAVVVASYNEPPEIVRETLGSLRTLDYPKDKLAYYLLDDSTDEKIVAELKAYCEKAGVTFIHRDNREGFKAGALNNFLSRNTGEEFLAIFDADESLTDSAFLNETLGHFRDASVSHVQTYKRYADSSLFANAVTAIHSFFYEFIQPARARSRTALFSGSCGVIRRAALDAVGGFPHCVIEDTAFSLQAEAKGFAGVFIPKLYAIGKPIEQFTSFARQQWRYNYGSMQLTPAYIKNAFGMPLARLLDYTVLIFGFHYLSTVFILFAVITFLLANADVDALSIRVSEAFLPHAVKWQVETISMLSIATTLATVLLTAKVYFNSFRLGFMAYFVNFAVAFARAKASIAALLGSPNAFRVISRGAAGKRSLSAAVRATWMELGFSLVMLLNAALYFLSSDIVSAFWLGWYGALFGSATVFAYIYG